MFSSYLVNLWPNTNERCSESHRVQSLFSCPSWFESELSQSRSPHLRSEFHSSKASHWSPGLFGRQEAFRFDQLLIGRLVLLLGVVQVLQPKPVTLRSPQNIDGAWCKSFEIQQPWQPCCRCPKPGLQTFKLLLKSISRPSRTPSTEPRHVCAIRTLTCWQWITTPKKKWTIGNLHRNLWVLKNRYSYIMVMEI